MNTIKEKKVFLQLGDYADIRFSSIKAIKYNLSVNKIAFLVGNDWISYTAKDDKEFDEICATIMRLEGEKENEMDN